MPYGSEREAGMINLLIWVCILGGMGLMALYMPQAEQRGYRRGYAAAQADAKKKALISHELRVEEEPKPEPPGLETEP